MSYEFVSASKCFRKNAACLESIWFWVLSEGEIISDFFKSMLCLPDVVTYTFNPSTPEVQADRSVWVWGMSDLHSEL